MLNKRYFDKKKKKLIEQIKKKLTLNLFLLIIWKRIR